MGSSMTPPADELALLLKVIAANEQEPLTATGQHAGGCKQKL
jgi:hypothetical protein